MTDEMLSEEQLDKLIKEDIVDDIERKDTIDPSVEQHIGEMGFLWNNLQKKMQEDNTCFDCKQKLFEEDAKEKVSIQVVEAKKVENGVVAFVSLCEKCYNELLKKEESKKEGEKDGGE